MHIRPFFIVVSIFLLPVSTHAQDAKPDRVWDPFTYFVGSWLGHETGRSGIGEGQRTYEFILGGTFLFSRNTSTFKPQQKNPKGEVHHDWTIFSRDNARKLFVNRQFNSEGFVNQFILDTLVSTDKKFVFVSEHSENAPPDLRARLTYVILSKNQFEETFELAFPGKDFEQFLKNSWKRR